MCLYDYISSPSNKVIPYLRVPITSILHPFYCTTIVECDFSLDVVSSLRRIEKLVRSYAELYNMIQFFQETSSILWLYDVAGVLQNSVSYYKLYDKVRTA